MKFVMQDYKISCDMPIVQGAIDGTHINVARSSNPFLEEY